MLDTMDLQALCMSLKLLPAVFENGQPFQFGWAPQLWLDLVVLFAKVQVGKALAQQQRVDRKYFDFCKLITKLEDRMSACHNVYTIRILLAGKVRKCRSGRG